MDVRTALKDQYHAGLAMLADCIALCPDELWISPGNAEEERGRRAFWRIAFHDVYFTHLYMGQGDASFLPPPNELTLGRRPDLEVLWRPPLEVEPYELPLDIEPCRQNDILEYITHVDGIVDSIVDGLDLETEDSGFAWYRNITKLSHEMMNLRHLQGHVGQLSELLMQRGIDTRWVRKGPRPHVG